MVTKWLENEHIHQFITLLIRELIMAESTSQKLGSLRSEISITLHTQHATRLWQGSKEIRDQDGKVIKPRMLGVVGSLGAVARIQREAANNCPFADYYLIRFEDKIMDSHQQMKEMTQKLMHVYLDDLPENIDVQRCVNIAPITYDLHVNSPLGYKFAYLLSEYDNLAKLAMTAAYVALMTRKESREWLENGARLIRQCFGILDTYRSSGVTRADDLDKIQEAEKRLRVTLPADVLSGERRAIFAPDIRKTSATGLSNAQAD